MRITATAASIVFVTAIFFAGSKTVHAQSTQSKKDKKKPIIYVIREGDSLTKIAKNHKTSYVRIYDANNSIKNPDLIYPGHKIRIPFKDEKLKHRLSPELDAPKPLPKEGSAPQKSSKSYPKASTPSVSTHSNGGGVWDRIAACESGGNWSINTGNGYYGGLQFSLSSWRAVGGSGLPSNASKSEQIARGKILQSRQGWRAWPACSARAGL